MKKAIIALLMLPVIIFSQNESENDSWQPIRYFLGSWEGESSGKAGIGQGTRTYDFVMDDTFVYSRNIMEFKPQEKNPEGEVHEDWGMFSLDEGRNKIVFRQFNVEGFVNQFTVDSTTTDGKTIFMNSEFSENAPPGMVARYTINIINNNEFEEIFDLGFGNGKYSCWMTNTWKRVGE